MSTLQKYLLDANVFIEAKRHYYAFDLCPGFWEALLWHQTRGDLLSIDHVRTELRRGGDDLTDWVNTKMPEVCFASTNDQAVVDAFGSIMGWVQSRAQFRSEAKAKFAREADGWLVAYAQVTGTVLVTHEELAREARKKVPLPNVCVQFHVDYTNTFEMLKDLGARFTWRPPA